MPNGNSITFHMLIRSTCRRQRICIVGIVCLCAITQDRQRIGREAFAFGVSWNMTDVIFQLTAKNKSRYHAQCAMDVVDMLDVRNKIAVSVCALCYDVRVCVIVPFGHRIIAMDDIFFFFAESVATIKSLRNNSIENVCEKERERNTWFHQSSELSQSVCLYGIVYLIWLTQIHHHHHFIHFVLTECNCPETVYIFHGLFSTVASVRRKLITISRDNSSAE